MNTTAEYFEEAGHQTFNAITRTITDNATNALFLMDARGFCTFLNPAAEIIFGYKLSELQEKPLHDYVHYLHPDGTCFPITECPIGHSVFSLDHLKNHEDVFLRKDGSFISVKCSAKSIIQNGVLTGILLEVQDITEEKKREQALRDSEERYRTVAANLEVLVNERTRELQRSNNDLMQFAHVASHDLKEPVRKILLYAHRVQESAIEKLTAEEKVFVSKVIRAGERLRTMIDGILKYSTTNGTKQNIEWIDLNTIIEEIKSDLELVALDKRAIIEYQELPRIKGARILLHQLFYNLINNSLKFSRKGIDPHIRITSITDDDYSDIIVEDNGIGFHQKFADCIFDPFTRLHNKDEFEGTGLGLALCKKIVQRHSGSISAIGTEGGGASFIIRLPALDKKDLL